MSGIQLKGVFFQRDGTAVGTFQLSFVLQVPQVISNGSGRNVEIIAELGNQQLRFLPQKLQNLAFSLLCK